MEFQVLFIVFVLFFSTFVRAAFGFGDALLAMPILALILDIKTTTPLVALIASTIAIIYIIRRWREVRFQTVKLLIISSAFGIPLGLFFLKDIYEIPLKIGLALIIISFSLYVLFVKTPLVFRTDRWAWIFGFLAGVLGGAYNTNGPPVVIFGRLRAWDPNSFRATLQGYFLLSGSLIALGHGVSGLWTQEVIRLYLYAFPWVVFAIFLGDRLGRTIGPGKFDRCIHCLLIIASLLLLYQSLK